MTGLRIDEERTEYGKSLFEEVKRVASKVSPLCPSPSTLSTGLILAPLSTSFPQGRSSMPTSSITALDLQSLLQQTREMHLWHLLMQLLLLLPLLLHPPFQPLLLEIPLHLFTHERMIIIIVISTLVPLRDEVGLVEDS
jgi:hypothetical protein